MSRLCVILIPGLCGAAVWGCDESRPDTIVTVLSHSDPRWEATIAEIPDSVRPEYVADEAVLVTFDVHSLVAIDSAAAVSGTLAGEQRSVLLALPNSGERRIELSNPHLNSLSVLTWLGHVTDATESRVTLSVVEGVVAANIWIADTLFVIRVLSDTVHSIRRVAPDHFTDELPPQADTTSIAGDADPQPCTEPMSIVDVMLLYSQVVTRALAGRNGVLAEAGLAERESNIALDSSSVRLRIRIVSAVEAVYQESRDLYTDLERLTLPGDGQLDEVFVERDRMAADAVSLWVERGQACGYGQVNMQPYGNPRRAFSVVRRDCATGYFSFVHELGHNFGLRHNFESDSNAGVFHFSHGFRDPANRFRTIMAYACPTRSGDCEPHGRVIRFSNPALTFDGGVLGAVESADAAQSLNLVACAVAKWR